MNLNFETFLLKTTEATSCEEVGVIQALWSDYGKIVRYQLEGSVHKTVVVKHIILDQRATHPKGWVSGHDRKLRSYQIETNWYKNWSEQCNEKCRIPTFVDSYSEGNMLCIIMEDLDVHFPIRKTQLRRKDIEECLTWLANFHATFLNKKPEGLWQTGTYWQLGTRLKELEKIESDQLKQKASILHTLLENCQYQTIVHGDAKLANFCFSKKVSAEGVAAVDFQYVGRGCGMKDVAYFLGSCLASDDLFKLEKQLLDFYFNQLENALISKDTFTEFKNLKKEWLKMYPVACADFTRFLLGWNPTHKKINEYQIEILKSVLASV